MSQAAEQVRSLGELGPRAIARPLTRLGAVVASHAAVDVYAAFIAPMLGVLEVRCNLTAGQTASLLGIGAVSSGIAQPLSAWVSDRIDSRLFGAAGLAVAAVCLSLIGVANSFATLVPLFVAGMIGSGVFHPTGAASMGQMADVALNGRRSLGISVFHVAGMAGGIAGAIIVTRLTALPAGFALLSLLMFPGLLCAAWLHASIRHVPHRHAAHREIRFEQREIRRRWWMVWLLLIVNALRAMVNMAILYLFVRWVQDLVGESNPQLDAKAIARLGAPINGNLNALLLLGMAIGGLAAGALVRSGREKWPMVVLPIVFAPVLAAFPYVGVTAGYGLAVLAGIAFAAMMPVTIGMAQRLLPHRTTLASGLMMGGSWALSFMGPSAAELCLGRWNLGLPVTFALTAVVLAVSGVICVALNGRLLAETAGTPDRASDRTVETAVGAG